MLQTFFSTFFMIFLAELGDKTQLAVVALASSGRPPWVVFAGAAAALVASAGLAVLLGCALSRVIPDSAVHILHRVAGVLFILVGIWTVWKA